MNNRITLGNIMLVGLLSSTTLYASTPVELRDMIGARASSGESILKDRGYKYIKTQKSNDRSWTYWLKSTTDTCIAVATYDGRYESITESPNDCQSSSSMTGGQKAAAIIGSAVALGAAAAIIKHEHDKKDDEHHNNDTPREIKNLVGNRESGAERILRDNRYYHLQGDNYSNNRKQSLWWNYSQTDCIKMTVSNGKVSSIENKRSQECRDHQSNNSYQDNNNHNNHNNHNSGYYSPSSGVTCYEATRQCYRAGKGVDQYWTNREF